MYSVSSWTKAAAATFGDPVLPELFKAQVQQFNFIGRLAADSLWIEVTWAKHGAIAFRAAYAPGGGLQMDGCHDEDGKFIIRLRSVIGEFEVTVAVIEGSLPILHYTTTLAPSADMTVPFWPRDILIPGKKADPENTEGEVFVKQLGTRSGHLYFKINKPEPLAVFYLQNLTALGDYCQLTQTSAGDTVGGEWPELGFSLPPAINNPLPAGKATIINDAYVAISTDIAKTEAGLTQQLFNMLAELYLQLPKPGTSYRNWPEILDKGLNDLLNSPGCWSQVGKDHYFNAYFCDFKTPPEIMVQLAVLLPLIDYKEWNGQELDVINTIKAGLPAFYNEKLKTVMRWHPKVADQLEEEEEQKKPMIMDSWYLHHPLLNLSRLALKGDEEAKQLFLDSLDFSIKVAHQFNYNWPVFYKMDTLEIVKAETAEGAGGEHDVPGLYAHVMLQAYELTGEKRYLAEAEKSAKKLSGLGFNLMYQANNTAFSAGALLRLFKVTGNNEYLDLSYLCLANIFKNVRLWDINYGYMKAVPGFFALYPLNDAPYTAVYEEQEVFCALHDYLRHAEGLDILPSVRLLVAEYIKYLVERAAYYYPPMLQKEMLQEKPKIGEVAPDLYIALEDLQDGWQKSGQVGQEVYGAGNAFGILPRHYMQVAGEEFMIFCDYPVNGFTATKKKPVTFQLAGDGRTEGRVIIVKTGRKKLPQFKVNTGRSTDLLKGKPITGGHVEYVLAGNQKIKIDW
ncbi:hypothetical protein ACFS5N_09210 [Mucilaginibacter ximonensis]|uniref:Alpha-L-rhamnosidase six-hairpin glycosidase domain-containing protein n=1 Tax=Mucilaginibacter ximonensis TaxID=538021 RepID=A0ABW5YCF1_9SPHI